MIRYKVRYPKSNSSFPFRVWQIYDVPFSDLKAVSPERRALILVVEADGLIIDDFQK
jgi:hypothetical protein